MAGVRWLDDDEQQAWRAFLEASHRLVAVLDAHADREAGIPQSYYEILVRLSEAPGRAMRMSDLASASFSSRSRLSHAVSRLEKKAWVRRQSCPSDGRGSLAVLTDEGFATLAAAAPGHVAAVRAHVFDRLSPEQVSQLREISRAIVAGLGEGGG